MTLTMEQAIARQDETQEIEVHEQDLICDLGRRLACVWSYERFLASADGRPELQEFWRDAKSQEKDNIAKLTLLIQRHVLSNCF